MSLGVEDSIVRWLNASTPLRLELKRGDGPRFIRPWRLNDRSGRETKELISCSAGECGCGISPDLK